MNHPELSIVIPVYNEADTLPILCERLFKSLDALNKTYEVIFTNDGSKDTSLEVLKGYHQQYPDKVRIIDFHGNYGQHMAIMAAFEKSRGNVVINLDADLQNPPEEIYKLLEKIDAGYDYVGSYRDSRKDNFFRTYISKFMNWIRASITDIHMKDQGCMFRAYSRHIIDKIVASHERSTFIPALGYRFAINPAEIEMRHEPRAAGESKYSLYQLIRVSFDLVTSFSLVPLQLFTLFGMSVSVLSSVLVVYMFLRRLFIGPEVEGVFTLFAILFFLISVLIMGVGLIGEYLGRVFQSLSQQPRFIIKETIENNPEAE
jgi:undecaprenyl-phosphate 4-deoxy-4-formamido-L-arabinose transferase